MQSSSTNGFAALPILLACAAATVHAQQLPAEGKLSVTYTAVNASPIRPMAIGKDQDMSISSSMMTAINDAGIGLLHNLGGRCMMSTIIDKAAKTFEQHGYCTYTDADGDQLFEKVAFDKQPLGSVLVAKGTWVGGTGKFTGLEGTVDIRHASVRSAIDGIVQGAGKKTGNYRIARQP